MHAFQGDEEEFSLPGCLYDYTLLIVYAVTQLLYNIDCSVEQFASKDGCVITRWWSCAHCCKCRGVVWSTTTEVIGIRWLDVTRVQLGRNWVPRLRPISPLKSNERRPNWTGCDGLVVRTTTNHLQRQPSFEKSGASCLRLEDTEPHGNQAP